MGERTLVPNATVWRLRVEPRSVQVALLVALALASFGGFALDAINAAVENRVFIGASGTRAADQLQYLSWATDSAHHGFSRDLYAFHLGSRVFLDPLWLVTGLLHVRGGLSYSLLTAIWQSVALLLLFAAVRVYARSLLGAGWQATIAMLLALFMLPFSFLVAHVRFGSTAGLVSYETLSIGWISGDIQLALAVAAMIVFLLQVRELLVVPNVAARRRPTWLAAGAGVAASWLHPWQGMLLLLILVMLVLWERPSLERHRRLLAPALLTALPVAYYALLSKLDASWAYAASSQQATAHGKVSLAGAFVVALLPIAVIAAPGYADRRKDPGDRMLKLWPIASVILFVALPADTEHAMGGVAVPAAVLMVRGWPWVLRRLPRFARGKARWVAAAAISFSVIGAPLFVVQRLKNVRAAGQIAAEIAHGDALALDSIASRPLSSGVLTSATLGAWVPVVTDQATWVGHGTWTPSYSARSRGVSGLFNGSMDSEPRRERRFVLSIGASYVLEPCGWHARLQQALLPAGFTARKFGCATLYSKPA